MNTSSSARLRPFRPQAFGRYTLLSHLATGGMGEIYLARLEGAQGFEKLCVIKKILPQLAEDKEFVDRFVGEARTLVKLSHGSIAQVLDMGLHEGEAYMALEYVDGKDLRKVAGRVRDRHTPLPLTFILFVMGRVLDALAYAHRKRDDDEKDINLVHRDISPQNILISYEGEVKVVDFGLAKSRLSAAKTNPSIILGKFLYMSPEQARHQPVDRRSDLYAVGLCLYELISGKNPFDAVHSGDLMSVVAHPRIAPLGEVEPLTPSAVANLVMKALAVEPAQRFQTAEEFRAKLMGVLMDIDRNAGPETVSRFMRELFAQEFAGERKLLAQLKEVPRGGEPLVPRMGTELDTDPAARFPPPSLPPKTIKLDPPPEPLSFQPTPRSRPGAQAHVHEEETRPGVVVNSETTRPAVSFEALDAAARARVRSPLSSLPPAPDTVTVELGSEDFGPFPGEPVSVASPAPARLSAPTVEMPVPYMPAAAIPPSAPSSPQMSGTARTLEAPRAVPPPPLPAPSASGNRPPDPPLRAAMPGALPPGSVPTKPGEMPSPRTPPAPPSSSAAARLQETQRVTLPPPPSSAVTPEPRRQEASRAESSPASATASPAVMLPFTTPSTPMPAVSAESPPPVPEVSLPAEPQAEIVTAPRELPRSMSARAAQADPGSGGTDASRRGLDDTHPSYQMASSPPPADTQPRVVLDELALQNGPEEGIVPGIPEEPLSNPGRDRSEDSISVPGRPRTGRRPRSTGGTPASLPAMRGGTASVRAAQRPVEPVSAPPERAETDDSAPVAIAVDDPTPAEARDPRDDTRRTPLPTRPPTESRRAQREEARRPAAPPAPAQKRSWGWMVLSLVLLLGAAAAVYATLPMIQALVKSKLEDAKPAEPGTTRIQPTPVPSGPPGQTPAAAPPTPEPAAATPPASPAPTEAAAPPPAGAVAAVTPEVPVPESASPDEGEDDDLLPLPATPSPPPKKSQSSRSSKKASAALRKEVQELKNDWTATKAAYAKLTQEVSCEATTLGLLCSRYDNLRRDYAALGENSYDKEIHSRVKRMRTELNKALSAQ
ncbi:serine/threonine-protein kinase [Hyalangium minutum]|uniref:Serine/threonine-protein kinase Pkn6 n=1 Tax=Hyalangium minutum TaxID=394096 RepID=A0A085WMQ7_9BACT|nr:serine/threonine-protein kinase [Hyalangium minutum]KFE68970.1 Serine/threonine-protein kinase Pkn6 [Hyalangium minutum]